MDKRYQVFVSSTFTDLEQERSAVIQTLMEMDCIPAGMELFPAIDEEQWEFIKKVIDDCDYYLLIVGGRYGTIADDGLSYTEKEFDYAVSKGLKVVVLVHENPESLPLAKSERNDETRDKLLKFIDKASSGRLRKEWSTVKDIPGLVSLSMSKTIKTYPAIGWVRADKLSNESDLRSMIELQKENERLRKEIEEKKPKNQYELPENIAGLDKEFTINYRLTSANIMDSSVQYVSLTKSFSEIFSFLSPIMFKGTNEVTLKNKMNEFINSFYRRTAYHTYIDDNDFQVINLQFVALGLTEVNGDKFSLTPLGKNTMMSLKLVRE
ncbi:DUF4062 domain-containing protein [Pantoea agglomerans]|uniref:DUF4062 domain-containing protein n=1 Tax=Enterobacter agglomerans TaxID=549 RepID=UPI0022714924|nr:DUF4062 domain-containing protein [Pantoea agglomerans]WAB85456.1 DUF4062 domain-containing protein [Pantoea agglomerans]